MWLIALLPLLCPSLNIIRDFWLLHYLCVVFFHLVRRIYEANWNLRAKILSTSLRYCFTIKWFITHWFYKNMFCCWINPLMWSSVLECHLSEWIDLPLWACLDIVVVGWWQQSKCRIGKLSSMKLELVKIVSRNVPEIFHYIAELYRTGRKSVLRAFSEILVGSLG